MLSTNKQRHRKLFLARRALETQLGSWLAPEDDSRRQEGGADQRRLGSIFFAGSPLSLSQRIFFDFARRRGRFSASFGLDDGCWHFLSLLLGLGGRLGLHWAGGVRADGSLFGCLSEQLHLRGKLFADLLLAFLIFPPVENAFLGSVDGGRVRATHNFNF